MRISTNMIYQNSGSQISSLQSAVNQTMQEISSGTQILTPSDNPIGAARALVITQAAALNDQYAVNRQDAQDTLGAASNALSNVVTTLQSIKSTIVSAGNPSLTDTDRANIATTLQTNLSELIGLANSTDGTGGYLFSGFSTTTAPFVQTPNGVSYQGDQGQRTLQVDTATQISLSASGQQIFGNIRTSAGQFNIVPSAANNGNAVVTAVVNPATAANLTGANYTITFDSSATNYTVTNAATGAVVVPTTAYVSGQAISFDGINATISNTPPAGGPGSGDQYTIQPGNQNVFETVTDVINALKTPTSNAAQRTNLTNALNQGNSNIDLSLGNVLTVSAQIGSNIQQIGNLNTLGAANKVSYQESLSSIQDLDYAKAITTLNQQQTTLQAAQQSFVKVSSLSLFNYIGN